MTRYGISRELPIPFDEAVAAVTARLQEEGFGVLTSIDISETLRRKLNVEFKRYTILGACNPHFAHMALQAEEEIGLLLPCNVIVYEKNGHTAVSAFNPMVMAEMTDNATVTGIADEVQSKLQRVINRL
ncbi:MAG: DUF302 domain-containing protein [Ignavibacteria bacterium]|nr:DUF302 domain-containing protein [Ignavibacteria bacterium]